MGKKNTVVCKLVLSTVMLLSPFMVNAAKMYKWIDGEGNVTYSQLPPPDGDKIVEEEVNLLGVSNEASVTRYGNYDYCGDMKLPGPVTDPEKQYRNTVGKRNQWRRELISTEQSLRSTIQSNARNRSYNAGGYNDEHKSKLIQRISELKCALSWELRKREEFRDVKMEIEQSFQRAQTNYDIAIEKGYKACGVEPPIYNTQPSIERHNRWNKCMSKYRRAIRDSQSDVERAQRDYELLRE